MEKGVKEGYGDFGLKVADCEGCEVEGEDVAAFGGAMKVVGSFEDELFEVWERSKTC